MIVGVDRTVIADPNQRGGFQIVPASDGSVRMVILHEGTRVDVVMSPEEASHIGTLAIKASAVAAIEREKQAALKQVSKGLNGAHEAIDLGELDGIVLPPR
jgi:hypothetical protein